MGNLWTDEDKNTLRILHAAGKSYAEIAKALNRSVCAVTSKVNQLGVTQSQRWTPEAEAHLTRLMANGASLKRMLVVFPECSAEALRAKCARLRKKIKASNNGRTKTTMKNCENRLFLMNSAMMPNDGRYEKTTISPESAQNLFRDVNASRRISYLGYPNVVEVASELFGERMALNRTECKFSAGDAAICFQLRYRILAPGEKADNDHGSKLEDYNISLVRYLGGVE